MEFCIWIVLDWNLRELGIKLVFGYNSNLDRYKGAPSNDIVVLNLEHGSGHIICFKIGSPCQSTICGTRCLARTKIFGSECGFRPLAKGAS
jgi:hypothetical protein